MQVMQYRFESIRTGTSAYKLQIMNRRELSRVCHTHDFYEIILVTEGVVTQSINGTEVSSEAGSCILLCPGDSHVITKQPPDAGVICLSVEREEFESFCKILGAELLCDCSPSSAFKNRSIGDDFHLCLATASKCFGSFGEAFLKRLLTVFITRLSEEAQSLGTALPVRLSRAISEMEKPENLREGLPALIRLSGYSHTHLSRLIKRETGKSVHELILGMRLSAAYGQIVYTDLPFEEISELVGYESFSHFNKIFKKRFGQTPSALRKRNGFKTV